MDIKEFAQEFIDGVNQTAEEQGTDQDYELTKLILEYIEDSGEVNIPEICTFKNKVSGAGISAYDYNDQAESLDLFYLIKAGSLMGSVKSKVNNGFNYLSRFYKDAMRGSLFKNTGINQTDEIYQIAEFVRGIMGSIERVRLFVITDGIADPTDIPAAVEDEDFGIIKEFHLWDIQHIFQQHNIREGKDKIDIDFQVSYNTKLQCLKMDDSNPYVDVYLAVIPGLSLAKIYRKYQQSLLEKNVRTFLQFKSKVNKEIRQTLRLRPDLFLSFNNGISSTAKDVKLVVEHGTTYISRIVNWQIVNGGQTTAAIAASYYDKEVDLNKVKVSMKVSVIKDVENENDLIKDISRSANSQTAIKNSDLSSNDPYLQSLEKFSRETWVPNGNNQPYYKWYFERTRGQYFDQLSLKNGFDEKSFKKEFPKSMKIVKTDIAKYENAWNQSPFNVCTGAEKNYAIFAKKIINDRPTITPLYFKKMIAKAIIYRTIDKMVRTKNLGGYKAHMDAYLMASVSYLSKQDLNLSYIWENQGIQPEVYDKIEELIPLVWDHLTDQASTTAQGRSIDNWGKSRACWEQLKLKLDGMEKFGSKLMQPDTNDDGSYLNDAQQQKIAEAQDIEANYWFKLVEWATKNNQLSPLERKEAFNLGTMGSRGRKISKLKQALKALAIIEKAKEQGFNQ